MFPDKAAQTAATEGKMSRRKRQVMETTCPLSTEIMLRGAVYLWFGEAAFL